MENEQPDFLDKAIKMLAARTDSGVLIIINGPSGFEIMSSHPDPVFQCGMVKLASLTIDERYRGIIVKDLASGNTEAHERNMANTLNKKTEGGVN